MQTPASERRIQKTDGGVKNHNQVSLYIKWDEISVTAFALIKKKNISRADYSIQQKC